MARNKQPIRLVSIRTAIVLLTVLILMIIALAGFTIKSLKNERKALEETIRESRAQAMGLLSARIEQEIINTVKPPFLPIKSASFIGINEPLMDQIKESFPELEQIILIDDRLHIYANYPKSDNRKQGSFNRWLAQHIVVEGITQKANRLSFYTFLANIEDQPTLVAIEPIESATGQRGWILIRYNLQKIISLKLQPILTEFSEKHAGSIALQDPNDDWDDEALNWPIGHLLPAWLLVFKPDTILEERRLNESRQLLVGTTAGIILTLILGMFSVWREIRREYALVALRNQFIANVSHELRTPLALIRMYAETLSLKRITDPERTHHYHLTILREAERLSKMINRVLDFSRLQQGETFYHLTDKNLFQTISDVLRDYGQTLKEQGVSLKIDLASDISTVAHDRDGITQVLLNLLDNAIKYGDKSQPVTVSLKNTDNGVEFAVSDYGVGVSAKELKRIKLPFERGENVGTITGSGLGLYLVDQIAKAHHAKLVLDRNKNGFGFIARIIFPGHKDSE